MTRKKAYLWIQAAVCIILVLWLSATAVSIFRDGQARREQNPLESVYSPEIVAERTAPAMPLLFGALGLTLAGLVLGVKDEEAEKPVKDVRISRDLVTARVAQPSGEMKREQAAQRKLKLAGWGVFALSMVPVAVYLCSSAHFPQEDYDAMLFGVLRVLVPCTCVGILALAVTSVMREKSMEREIRAAQAVLKEEKRAQSPSGQTAAAAFEAKEASGTKKTGSTKKQRMIQTGLVVAAVVLIIAGIINLSARDVLYKAITICTECVGLG